VDGDRRAEWYRLYREGARAFNQGDARRALKVFAAIPTVGDEDLDASRLALVGKAMATVAREDGDRDGLEKAARMLHDAIESSDNPQSRRIARSELAAVRALPKPDGSLATSSERAEAIDQLETLLLEQPDVNGREAIEGLLRSVKWIHRSPLNVAAALLAIEEDLLNDRLADDLDISDNQ
jgi:hypothetical protein